MSQWTKKVADLLGDTPRRRRESAKVGCESLEGRQLLSQFGQMGLGRRAMGGRSAHVSKVKRLGGMRSLRLGGTNNQMMARAMTAPFGATASSTPTATAPKGSQTVAPPMNIPSEAPQTPPPWESSHQTPIAGTPDTADAHGFGSGAASQENVFGLKIGGPAIPASGQQSALKGPPGHPGSQFPSRMSFGPQGDSLSPFASSANFGPHDGPSQQIPWGPQGRFDQGMPARFGPGADSSQRVDPISMNLSALPGFSAFTDVNNVDSLLSALGDGPGGDGPFGGFDGVQPPSGHIMAYGRPDFGGGHGMPGQPGEMWMPGFPGASMPGQREPFVSPGQIGDLTSDQLDAITKAYEAVQSDLDALMPTEAPKQPSAESINTYLKDQKASLDGILENAEATLTADRQNILVSTGLTADQATKVDAALQGLEADQLAIRKGTLTGTEAKTRIKERLDSLLIARGATTEQLAQLDTDLKSFREALDAANKKDASSTT